MESARLLGLGLELEHRHGDEWVRLEEHAPAHDPAASDPERDWSTGVIYACTRCEEYVRVRPREREPNG